MKLIRSVVTCILGLCLSIAAVPAFARYTDCTAPLPMTLSTPNVGVLSSLQVGQPIPGTRTNFSFQVTCNFTFAANESWHMSANDNGLNATAYPNVYTYGELAASGIGLRVLNAMGAPAPLEGRGFKLQAATSTSIVAGSFELVKISNAISTSPMSTRWWFHVPDQQWANQTDVQSTLTYNFNISRPSIPTCSVDSPSLSVTLPTVGKQAFRAMGATAGAKAFNLGLHCEASVQGQLSFSDMASPANGQNSLTLAAGATATGLGIQLLAQGRVVQFVPAGTSTGTLLDVQTGSSAQAIVIPLMAQYVQTAASVTPGTVIANAAYTLTYR